MADRGIDFRLYLITDRKLIPQKYSSPIDAVEDVLKGGVKAVQLREKDLPVRELLQMAYRLRELTASYNARLFINDRVDVAISVRADGVHLGQNSMPPEAVRRITGVDTLIGVSAHSLGEAVAAQEGGADFITFGPIYDTPSKRRYGPPVGIKRLAETVERVTIPVFGLGGIELEHVRKVIQAGAYGVSLISAILSSEDIRGETERFMRVLS